VTCLYSTNRYSEIFTQLGCVLFLFRSKHLNLSLFLK